LTAIHLAVQALRAGECAWALAGGVNLMPHPEKYLQLAAGQWLSRDGRCRSFGEGGTGYVPGEGVGALLLKPLAAALADGDHVHGVIRGSRLNHGGRASGFTVPNPAAQTEVVVGALAAAGTDPATVTCIEAHGTGTSLGDPIEVQGLREAYAGVDTTCSLGSVKSVIGHLESAAGVAAVTKVLLQLRHRTLVPTLHSDDVNPALRLDDSPFRLQRTAEPWQPGPAGVRRAGVSSFGAGGSNAHLVVEEAPAPPAPTPAPAEGPAVLVLSAEDDDQLARVARDMLAFLDLRDGDAVRRELAALLGVSPDDVPVTVPLRDLGLERVDLGLLASTAGLRADELAHRTLADLALDLDLDLSPERDRGGSAPARHRPHLAGRPHTAGPPPGGRLYGRVRRPARVAHLPGRRRPAPGSPLGAGRRPRRRSGRPHRRRRTAPVGTAGRGMGGRGRRALAPLPPAGPATGAPAALPLPGRTLLARPVAVGIRRVRHRTRTSLPALRTPRTDRAGPAERRPTGG